MRRRDFLLGGAAGVSGLYAAGSMGPALGSSAEADSQSRARRRAPRTQYGAGAYAHATVIDAQAVIPDPDPNVVLESAPSQRLLTELQASGLTAVSMTLNVGSTGDRMVKAFRKIATFDEKVAAAADRLMRIRTGADLRTAKASGRLGLIYNLQDSSLLENDLSRVNLLQQLGVRIMQLTYNTRNLVGDGCLEPDNAGLSNLGHQLVAELARVRMLMDLSHAGQRTIAEAIAEAKAPPIISHSGCRSLVDRPRNVFDTELRALADKGGVVGIYFMPFLSTGGSPSRDDLIRHIEHAVNACGEDHVGLGTDGQISAVQVDDDYREEHRKEYESRVAQGIAAPGEGAEVLQFIPEYNAPERFLLLADDLAARGWAARRIEKILGLNFARVFAEVWG